MLPKSIVLLTISVYLFTYHKGMPFPQFVGSLLRLHGVEWSSDSFIRKRKEFGRKQSNANRGNDTATHLDIRDRVMGMQQAIQHQDPPNIPVKNAQNDQ